MSNIYTSADQLIGKTPLLERLVCLIPSIVPSGNKGD